MEKKYSEFEHEVLTNIEFNSRDLKSLTKTVVEHQILHGKEHEAVWKKIDCCSQQIATNTTRLHGIYAIGGAITAVFTGLLAWLKIRGE